MNLLVSPLPALVLGLCLLALMWVSLIAVSSWTRGAIQRNRLRKSTWDQDRSKDVELAVTLHQTYTDVSVRDRPAQWFDVQVVRVDEESADVKSFYLVESQGDSLPRFLPGQHLLLERPATKTEPVSCRCYSLSDACHGGHWRISVKKASEHPSSVSRWLHEEVNVGTMLRVRGPAGSFYLQNCTGRHIVLVSAGIGITPMLPMIKEVLQRPHASLSCFAQYRDVDHMPFAEVMLNVAHQFPQVNVRLFLGRFPRGVKGAEGNTIVEGKIQAADLCDNLSDLARTDFYLCGPEGWQSNLRNGLLDLGASHENIRFELFQESEAPIPATRKAAAESCSVHFRQSNKLTTFAATYPNLLGFATKTDIPMNSGCRTGACGACAVRLLQGKVRYTKKPQYQLKANEILPCVCVPDGDIVVDA